MRTDEELHQELKEDIAARKALIANMMQESLQDEDGYPTENALNIVEMWHWIDSKGWFEFIQSIWAYADWGWREEDVKHDFKDRIVHQYKISTAGWSGNESIIRAMQRNEMMWNLNWVQSRRGGHYIFEEREWKENETV